MSNLQILGRRCPVMGKAMAVQSARTGLVGLSGVYGGVKTYHSKANLHTTQSRNATPSEEPVKRERGRQLTATEFIYAAYHFYSSNSTSGQAGI